MICVFNGEVSTIKHLTPKSFNVDATCVACSKKFAEYCMLAHEKHPLCHEAGTRHLTGDAEAFNEDIIYKYNAKKHGLGFDERFEVTDDEGDESEERVSFPAMKKCKKK
jgi:hypothetical protein